LDCGRRAPAGPLGPAANQIQAFVIQVQDLVSDGILTAEQVEALIADAQGVLEVMQ
jgi:hypothetical protein